MLLPLTLDSIDYMEESCDNHLGPRHLKSTKIEKANIYIVPVSGEKNYPFFGPCLAGVPPPHRWQGFYALQKFWHQFLILPIRMAKDFVGSRLD